MDKYTIQMLEALCLNHLTFESLNNLLEINALLGYTQSNTEIIYKVCNAYLEQI